ncbi:MAG TPA: prepilin-type N-terminal cleavage/methylation domain-containing protein, partial [Phycisphaerae bacterium]|nr:prepilin-type N-terminal cleavage/methylation domain-containing protein [Phycisphaerae bacterium]
MNSIGRNNLDSPYPGGFTLIELLVVLLILAIGIALIVGVATTVQETARAEETKNIQRVVLAGLKAYYLSG